MNFTKIIIILLFVYNGLSLGMLTHKSKQFRNLPKKVFFDKKGQRMSINRKYNFWRTDPNTKMTEIKLLPTLALVSSAFLFCYSRGQASLIKRLERENEELKNKR